MPQRAASAKGFRSSAQLGGVARARYAPSMTVARTRLFCAALLALALFVPASSRSVSPRVKVVDESTVMAAGAELSVEIGPAASPVSRRAALAWVRRAAQLVVGYYGRFSVEKLDVEIVTGGSRALGWGQHFWGKRIEIHAGQQTTLADVERDWVMVHEMMHTAFPSLERKHRWMREGLSTYLEDVVRAQAGVVSEEEVWRRWRDRMPHGVPRPGTRGFDTDAGWGVTYWGGALFWLLADVRIREQTNGNKSLRDALQAVLEAGGTSRWVWKIDKAMRIGDRATGTRVLRDLYADLGTRYTAVDLEALFKRLGVQERGGDVSFDNDAELAAVRRALLAKNPDLRLTPLPR